MKPYPCARFERLSLFALLSVALFFVACKKDPADPDGGGGNQEPPAYTPIPQAHPLSTRLVVHPVHISQAADPYNVMYSGQYIPYVSDYGSFGMPAAASVDQYRTLIKVSNPTRSAGYDAVKVFTTLEGLKNYVTVKVDPLVSAGSGYYNSATTLPLPGNGQLVLPAKAFSTPRNAGTYSINTSYSSPFLAEYALKLPCYPMADVEKKRWYLNAYGLYNIIPKANNIDDYTVFFNADAAIILRAPIPAGVQQRPDSIPVWNLNELSAWQQNGYARRNGDFYEKRITKKGYWYFAVPTDGVYVTLRLRSSADNGVANIRYVVKSEGAEIAEGRTNSAGDALVFVPVNRQLTFDCIGDRYDMRVKDYPLGSFTAAGEKTIALTDRPDFLTLNGTVLDCNGAPLASGYIGLRNPMVFNDEFMFPVVKGKFSSLLSYNSNNALITATIYDAAFNLVNTQFVPVSFPLHARREYIYHPQLYTCANPAQLYCNYRDGSTLRELKSDLNGAGSTLTVASLGNIGYRLTLKDENGKGFSMEYWSAEGIAGYIYPQSLEVDGVSRAIDYTNISAGVYFSRDDKQVGGIREGVFFIDYRDASNVLHSVNGSFRVRIS
ncbi:hypothetical protein LZZ85_00300 [Terrimonas sp. NA20]|uniref:PKD-like family protein n=1 Tax=Terrimonas ginsenosidimutans TaxID=2908004 RepID=A0ABS9KK92_9BACT|nr:hypothetical protein [Terrimonas ginsenosidimutans]MCG2612690.1 hypothetical protein [Terrimonas ginsenosidimutans]